MRVAEQARDVVAVTWGLYGDQLSAGAEESLATLIEAGILDGLDIRAEVARAAAAGRFDASAWSLLARLRCSG